MKFNISLYDGNLSLVPMLESNFDDLYNVAKDPGIWEQHFDNQRYRLEIFKSFFAKGLHNDHGCFLVILDSQIVGSTRYYEYNSVKSSIKIGYTFYAKEFWGTDLNKRVKSLMLNYAFKYLENVYFDIWVKNYRSQKAILKIGAKFICGNHEDVNKLLYLLEKKDYISKEN